jgi:hypothetical protein
MLKIEITNKEEHLAVFICTNQSVMHLLTDSILSATKASSSCPEIAEDKRGEVKRRMNKVAPIVERTARRKHHGEN